MHYVYILICSDNTYYTGYTKDVYKRLQTHNKGKGAKYTRIRLPVKIIYLECFEDKSQALSREYKIKQLTRKQKEVLINKTKINKYEEENKMGTRHLTCVVKDGEYKVAQYGQWDGYPTGQGKTILNFLSKEIQRDLFEKQLSEIFEISDAELKLRWIEAGADPKSDMVNMVVSENFKKMYPENNRDTGAKILSIIQYSNKILKLENDIEFATDSLFCEWVYVIDLDKNTFEVYEGYNKIPLSKDERFYFLQQNQEDKNKEEKCYPVKHVISFDLNKLPSEEEFFQYFESKDENEA